MVMVVVMMIMICMSFLQGGDPSGGDSRPTTLEETLLFPRQSTPVPASASGTRGSSEPHPTQFR